jgi:transforming growth factor-beta-induced protein
MNAHMAHRSVPSFVLPLIMTFGLMSLAACNGEVDQPVVEEDMLVDVEDRYSVVDALAEDGRFTRFISALQAAELEQNLRTNGGPYTVFAPTDEAFAQLPEGTLDDLMLPENRDQLRSILTYHIVDGEYDSRALAADSTLATLEGSNLDVRAGDDALQVDGIPVSDTDMGADNGIIHVIGEVLMPPDDSPVL